MAKVLDMSFWDVLPGWLMTEDAKDLVALARTDKRAAKAKVKAAQEKHGTHVATAKALGMSRSRLYAFLVEVGL